MVSSQANNAIVLAAFAFAAFIFLLNSFGTREAFTGEKVQILTRSHEGRALFLLAAAFATGIGAAFLFSSSAGRGGIAEEWGFLIALVGFALEVLALIAPVIVLIDLYLVHPGPIAAWIIGVGLTGYVVVQMTAELGRAWANQEGAGGFSGNVWLVVIAVTPAVVFLLVAVLSRNNSPESTLGRAKEFASRSAVGYSVMIAASGLLLAITHLVISFRTGIDEVSWWLVAGLALIVGTAAALTAVQSWPDTRRVPASAVDGSSEVAEESSRSE